MNRATLSAALSALALLSLLRAPALAQEGQEVRGQEPNRGGEVNLETADPKVALQRLTPAEGYEVSLFASELDFPIGKPVAMAFDSRGRLWVSTSPTYPHYEPGTQPLDKLVVLEDTDGDGRADRHSVFADSLYLAIGFELGDGGVYVSQQPNLMFLKDTDGDGRADYRRVLLHGFGTGDSHHAIHAFTWGPDGALYMQEGTFHYSQVETPYGPVRDTYASVFRYEPRTERFEVYVSYPFANPWGHVFDRWGQNFIADASNGNNYFALPITGRVEYPQKHPEMRVFTSRVRPTGGAELVSSRHFPDEAQGNFLISNNIGFQGIKSHRVIEEGSGFTSTEANPLLFSSDINFRPIDMEFGPDGALYLVDWFNPLVGHMQYSLRDPRRDRTRGRVWRVTYKGRPLLQPVNLETLSVPQLLEQLRVYEDRTRYRARRELRARDPQAVRQELGRWLAALQPSDSAYEHLLLEGLWVGLGTGELDDALLRRLLGTRDYRARAAATRVLRHNLHRVPDHLALLRRQVEDEHPRVRLEAVVALSQLRSPEAAEIALLALKHPIDYYLGYGLGETVTTLESQWKPVLLAGRPFAADNPEGVLFLIERLKPDEVARVALSEPVSRSLLRRPGVPLEARRAAARDLAARQRTTATRVLLEAARAVSAEPGGGAAAGDLATLLGEAPQAELAAERAALEELARTASSPLLRQGGYLGLMRADGGVERAWQLAARSRTGTVDLLDAASLATDPALRAELYPRVKGFLEGALPAAEGAAAAGVRYVRIEQPGCCETQSLAEVQVFDGSRNLAASGRARQKSTAIGGEPQLAVDGNVEGNFRLGSVSQSAVMEADPWWELDLGEARPVSSVAIWKRTDDPLSGDMSGFHLRLLDSERRPVFVRERNDASAQPIVFTVSDDSARLARRAAVRALAALPGPEAERLALLGDLLRRGVEADLALAGAAAMVGKEWKGGAAEATALAERALAHGARIPSADRSGPSFKAILDLTRALGTALPAGQAQQLAARAEALVPKQVRIRAVPSQMRFDVTSFSALPGQEVEIVLENPDEMPHNLVVTAPGAREKVGRAADAMAARPDAYQKHFVPDLPEVLAATPLINTGETARLRLTAPSAAGDYPFICSFPGHWITMVGTMRVAPAGGPTR